MADTWLRPVGERYFLFPCIPPLRYDFLMETKPENSTDAQLRPRSNTRNTGAAPKIRKMKLRYPELSEVQIAKRVGCDPANVHRVLKRFLGKKQSQDDLRQFQADKADVFDALQHRALMSVTDAKLAKTGVRDLAVAAGIWEDKARIVRGQATQINVNVLLDAVQAIRDMRSKE